MSERHLQRIRMVTGTYGGSAAYVEVYLTRDVELTPDASQVVSNRVTDVSLAVNNDTVARLNVDRAEELGKALIDAAMIARGEAAVRDA